jgi:uncharacterized membrane protein
MLLIVLAVACSDVEPTAVSPQFGRLDASAYTLVDLGAPMTNIQAFGIDEAGTVYGRWGGLGGSSFKWTRQRGFEDLGALDGMPFNITRWNNRGMLTGWVATGPFPSPIRPVAFLQGKGFRYLDDAAHRGQAIGVNEAGIVVGTRNPIAGGPSQAFVWTERDGMAPIPVSITVGALLGASAQEISARGVIVGTVTWDPPGPPCCQITAFLWSKHAGTSLLPKLSFGHAGVTHINTDNVVVGASETRLPFPGETRVNPLSFTPGTIPVHAWRWSEANGLEDLGTLGGTHSVAWTVDEAGNAYGWAMNSSGQQRAVKWPVGGGILEMGTLGGTSQAGGVNHKGHVAGQSVTTAGQPHAVLFIPNN